MPEPRAPAHPLVLEKHGHARMDEYYWLRERDNPRVLAYLQEENAWTEAAMAHTRPLQDLLYAEMVGRIKETDSTVPCDLGEYAYYTRFEAGREYPIHCRRQRAPGAAEQIALDVNELARDTAYCAVTALETSPDQRLLAYALDTVGRRVHTLRLKDLCSGEHLADEIPRTTQNFAWAEDGKTLFYTRQDPRTLRWHRIYRHALGTDPEQDVLVHEEQDPTFSCQIFKSRSQQYLFIVSRHTLSTEYRYLEAKRPEGAFRLFQPRSRDHEYHVDHGDECFYVRTNHRARNFRLMRAPLAATGMEHWQELIGHRDEVFLDGFELFARYLVVRERRDALVHLRVCPLTGGDQYYLDFPEPVYTAFAHDNREYHSARLRYTYTSPTTPPTVFDLDMESRRQTRRKQDQIGGGFAPENYTCERLYAGAADGVRIPLSLVYRKGLRKDGDTPLLLAGYGAYGAAQEPLFNPALLSLLDRGFAFAIAHVRGGGELGRAWYEAGKLLAKKNTFTDFIACAEHLVGERYTRPERLFISGGSAGGLLIGAVLNTRPDLCTGAIARVPFVDVLTTMLDESIPLTTSEYDEWGDPRDRVYYDYIHSYSPYDNVGARDYPHLLVLAGLHDSQVQYWEPAKWVARLRARRTNASRLLLQTRMEAGHWGVTGRYQQYRELAFQYAFLLDLARTGA